MADAIILQPDGEHVSDESVKPLASDLEDLTPEAIRTIARQMGLVGLGGGAAFPTAVKLAPPETNL